MSEEIKAYLLHILDECKFIKSVTDSLESRDDFIADETLKRAVIRSLEIIGEASKKIPDTFKVKYSAIEWKNMAGMRDRLIHHYMGVNYLLVWDVMLNKIPELDDQVSILIQVEINKPE